MTRRIVGNLSEWIYRKVGGEEIEDDVELCERIEDCAKSMGWKVIWLSEGLEIDYALLFFGEGRDEVIFLWMTENNLYLFDGQSIPENEVARDAFIFFALNYLRRRSDRARGG
ncbi:MAG: hypothetical protein QXK53_07105 [Nitrososphaerota archaeon]